MQEDSMRSPSPVGSNGEHHLATGSEQDYLSDHGAPYSVISNVQRGAITETVDDNEYFDGDLEDEFALDEALAKLDARL